LLFCCPSCRSIEVNNTRKYLVVEHLLKVLLVEVLSKPFSEIYCKNFTVVFHSGVNRRGWDCKQHQPKDLRTLNIVLSYSFNEFAQASIHDSLHNLAINICKPNTHVGP
jgi:hypothetical protein